MWDIDSLIKGEDAYLTTFPDGRSFKWRLLSMKEYKAYRIVRDNNLLNHHIVHEQVFERCYLGNPNLIDGDIPAGWIISIGKLIMHLSGDTGGLSDREDLIEIRNQSKTNSFINYMKRVIFRAFPIYRLEEMETWTRKKLMEMFIEAEELLVESKVPYEKIDPKHIMSVEDLKKAEQRKSIDYKKENGALNEAMGGKGAEDLIDLHPDEFARKRKIAQAMGKRRRPGG